LSTPIRNVCYVIVACCCRSPFSNSSTRASGATISWPGAIAARGGNLCESGADLCLRRRSAEISKWSDGRRHKTNWGMQISDLFIIWYAVWVEVIKNRVAHSNTFMPSVTGNRGASAIAPDVVLRAGFAVLTFCAKDDSGSIDTSLLQSAHGCVRVGLKDRVKRVKGPAQQSRCRVPQSIAMVIIHNIPGNRPRRCYWHGVQC
jgi:hypothetical protein